MNKVTIGLDTAKSVFHLISKNTQGRILNKKKLKRAQVLDFFANLPPSIVVMEACGSSHYWCRGIMICFNQTGHFNNGI
jgi:transposase